MQQLICSIRNMTWVTNFMLLVDCGRYVTLRAVKSQLSCLCKAVYCASQFIPFLGVRRMAAFLFYE